MFFIDSSDIKLETFLNYVFHNMINEIGSIKYQKLWITILGWREPKFYFMLNYYNLEVEVSYRTMNT